jgi:TolB-like protein
MRTRRATAGVDCARLTGPGPAGTAPVRSRRTSPQLLSATLIALAALLALAGCTSVPTGDGDPLGAAVEELFADVGESPAGGPVRVAVLPLVDAQSENPDELGRYIADDIVYEISVRLPERVQVVERDRIVELMRELELTNLSGVISDRDAKRMGEMSGADLLLIGTKLEMDETIQTRLRLVDVEAAEVRGAARATLPMTAEYASVRGSTESDVTDASAAGEPMALAADGSDEALDATVAPVATVATASAAAAPISISLGLGALAHLPVHEAVSPGFASRAGAILGHVFLPLYGDVALGYSARARRGSRRTVRSPPSRLRRAAGISSPTCCPLICGRVGASGTDSRRCAAPTIRGRRDRFSGQAGWRRSST